MITVSLCMIVKNEEQILQRCLDSLAGLMDEIIIVDTGSTDATKEIAARYTDQVYDFVWVNDFSAARNFAFSKAKRTKDGSAYITTVGPRGYSNHMYYDKKGQKKRKYKVSNALKAIWKEYGIAGKQAPRPFIANATRNAEEKVMNKLQEVYRNKTGGRE